MPYTIDPYSRALDNDSLTMRARAAMISAQLPHLSPGDTQALAQRQYTDQEGARMAMGGAAGDTRAAAASAMRAGAGGPGGIDVRSYTGSIYGPAGSAQPIAGYSRPAETANQAADRILRGQFGAPPNERGQMDIVTAMGGRSLNLPPMSPAQAMGYSAPNDPVAASRAAMLGGSSSPAAVPDYATPPSSVDELLRDARLPLTTAMQDRMMMAAERGQKIQAAGNKAAQDRTNAAALVSAMQPVYTPGGARARTPAEGLYVRRDPTIATPGATREPTVVEAMRGYLGAGGMPNASSDALLRAMGTARGPASVSFTEDPVTGARFALSDRGAVAGSGTHPGMPGKVAPKTAAQAKPTKTQELLEMTTAYKHALEQGDTLTAQFLAHQMGHKSIDGGLLPVEKLPRGTAAVGAAPAGAEAKPVAGTRAMQGGHTFEYDGKAWKPVK